MACMIISFFLLFAFCVSDIRTRKLSLPALCLAIIFAAVVRLVSGNVWDGLFGGAAGAVIFLISLLSRGKLGRGDALLLTATGILLGTAKNIELFLAALFLCAVWAGGLLVIFRKAKNYEMPFVPFLTAAQFILIIFSFNT